MTFRNLADFGETLLGKIAAALADSGETKPHVYRWWEPGMSTPAAYMWIGTQGATKTLDSCTVQDEVRLNLSIATRPAKHEGQDMLAVEAIVDAGLPIVNADLRDLSAESGIRSRVKRDGFRVVTDFLGADGQTEKVLVVEFPLVIPWNQHI